jgi:hypothetical protein
MPGKSGGDRLESDGFVKILTDFSRAGNEFFRYFFTTAGDGWQPIRLADQQARQPPSAASDPSRRAVLRSGHPVLTPQIVVSCAYLMGGQKPNDLLFPLGRNM